MTVLPAAVFALLGVHQFHVDVFGQKLPWFYVHSTLEVYSDVLEWGSNPSTQIAHRICTLSLIVRIYPLAMGILPVSSLKCSITLTPIRLRTLSNTRHLVKAAVLDVFEWIFNTDPKWYVRENMCAVIVFTTALLMLDMFPMCVHVWFTWKE